jgi:hypothetical protein
VAGALRVRSPPAGDFQEVPALNNLVYGNQDAAKLAAGVEEVVRKDVGSAAPLTFRVLEGGSGSATVGSVLIDVSRAMRGTDVAPLLVIELDLPGALPGAVLAALLRQGVGAVTGSLLYVFRLSRTVGGEVGFEDHKSFGTPKFTGDAAAAARLNGAKDLAKRADKVLRSESEMGSVKVKSPRIFKVVPEGGGSVLLLGTLPRLTSMGMSATTDAKEIIEIAGLVDNALG